MIIKVNGLVVRSQNVKENDKYLWILTKEYGKMMMRASGVRSFKSRYLTATQIFSYSEFTLMKTENFCKMNEAQLIENFYNIRLDIKKLALSAYLTDITSFVSVEGADDDVLNLLLNTLYALSYRDISDITVKSVYELKLLALIGFMPNIEECEICSKTAQEDISYYFNYVGGNLICEECFRKMTIMPPEIRRIDADLIKLIRFICLSDSKKIFSFKVDDKLLNEFARLSERYLLLQTEHSFATLDYYKSI